MLTISVSVRLPSDQAALARTVGDLSSSAMRIVLAVSATNITSCIRRHNRNVSDMFVQWPHQKKYCIMLDLASIENQGLFGSETNQPNQVEW